MVEDFVMESRRSIFGLLIKILIFFILMGQTYNLLALIIGYSSLRFWFLIFATIAYLIYRHITDKEVLKIKGKKLVIESIVGFPKKPHSIELDLDNIVKIRLIESDAMVFSKKKMELINQNGTSMIVELKFRYYQLAKLQEYLRDELKIETRLIR